MAAFGNCTCGAVTWYVWADWRISFRASALRRLAVQDSYVTNSPTYQNWQLGTKYPRLRFKLLHSIFIYMIFREWYNTKDVRSTKLGTNFAQAPSLQLIDPSRKSEGQNGTRYQNIRHNIKALKFPIQLPSYSSPAQTQKPSQ